MFESPPQILAVDDEPNALKVLAAILAERGFVVFTAENVATSLKILKREKVDVVITDMKMPEQDGMDLFRECQKDHPDVPVIFLTAYGSVESAVQAMTQGAFYYFIKPPDYSNLLAIVDRAVEQHRLKAELARLKKRVSDHERGPFMIGDSPQIRKIKATIDAVKDSDSSVLISGETGTGKELIARALHYDSSHRDEPFVAVNCAAIPGSLLEAELFGHEKGAFTGANQRRIGRIEQAVGGTLFLDEIGELELDLQAKLLRVIQEKEIERLGGGKKIKTNFRLISSTNRDLQEEVNHNRFRHDLFYRLNVVRIDVPPLRDRVADIPLLIREFLGEFCAREQNACRFSSEALNFLMKFPWPGNIRQLKNIVERSVLLTSGRIIQKENLPEELFTTLNISASHIVEKDLNLKNQEATAIKEALNACAGNKSHAAKMLGLSRKTLYKKLKDFGLSS